MSASLTNRRNSVRLLPWVVAACVVAVVMALAAAMVVVPVASWLYQHNLLVVPSWLYQHDLSVVPAWFYQAALWVSEVALAVIAVLTMIGIATNRIAWFLLASLVSVGWFLYLVLATDAPQGSYWIPLLAGFLVYLGYVWLGGRKVRNDSDVNVGGQEQIYSSLIASRRGVFSIFGFTIFATALFATSSLISITHVPLDPYGHDYLSKFAGETRESIEELDQAIKSAPSGLDDYAGKLRGVQVKAYHVGYLAEVTGKIAAELAETQPKVISDTINLELANVIADRTGQIASEVKAIQAIDADSPHPDILKTWKELAMRTSKMLGAATSLEAAATNMISIGRTPVPLMLLLLLFVTLLFFPWVLFFAFITSKRAVIARDTRASLEDLELVDRLLESTEGLGDEEQKTARGLVRVLDPLVKQIKGQTKNEAPGDEAARNGVAGFEPGETDEFAKTWVSTDMDMRNRFPATKRLYEQVKPPDRTKENSQNPVKPQHIEDHAQLALYEAQETIIKQRLFYTREYILPLVILTILSAVGWYYIFFPRARIGLAWLAASGTAEVLRQYLTRDLSALTAAFIGGWLYVTVLLITRWTQDDLLPRSYFYAATRLVVAFVVGLLFASLVGPTSSPPTFVDGAVLLLAFAVGAAPYDYVDAVFKRIAKGLGSRFFADSSKSSLVGTIAEEFAPPVWRSKQALTILEGVTIWDEARFEEEGIDSVHALATADLERLVIATPFPSQNLIDWVDQALLHVHATDLWYSRLAATGIRTATDLLDRCWPSYLSNCRNYHAFENTDVVARACLAGDSHGCAICQASEQLGKASKGLTSAAEAVKAVEKTASDCKVVLDLLRPVNGAQGADMTSRLQSLKKTLDDAAQALNDQDKEANASRIAAVTDLKNATSETENRVKAAAEIAEKSPTDPNELSSKVEEVRRAAEALASRASHVAALVQASVPTLTADMLENMLVAMSMDPNLEHTYRFWQNRNKRITQGCRTGSDQPKGRRNNGNPTTNQASQVDNQAKPTNAATNGARAVISE